MTKLRAISLGAGVQSTTLALLAKEGELEMPDCAIFADTQWEPQAVYEHLEWLRGKLPFPVHVVTAGSLKEHVETSKKFIYVPYYARSQIGPGFFFPETKLLGPGRRECTGHFKIEPIVKKLRELLGVTPRKRLAKEIVDVWVGISTDEASRMKLSEYTWQRTRWPLIEKAMSRQDCKIWLFDHGYPLPPKSACEGCPFMDDERWLAIKTNQPEVWQDLVRLDKSIRYRKPPYEVFMHRSCVPLDEVIFRPERDDYLYNNECTGYCGI